MAVVPRRTKIVATIGPASSSPGVLESLMRIIDGARLNFSHGTHEDHAERAQVIRAMGKDVGRPVALIADLQGPKLRIGELAESRVLVGAAVGEVQPRDVHTGLDHADEHLGLARGGPDRGDDLRAAHGWAGP